MASDARDSEEDVRRRSDVAKVHDPIHSCAVSGPQCQRTVIRSYRKTRVTRNNASDYRTNGLQ